MKKALSILLALALLLPGISLAEGWTCPGCGQEGNTGNFCSNCATPRPAADWTCPACGQEGNTGNFCSNCAEPRPAAGQAAPEPEPETAAAETNPHWEQIPGEGDRVMVRLREVQAGTYITNKKNPSLWAPSNAADGDESTCWQFSSKKIKQGWIELVPEEAETIDEIWIKNGFWAVNDKGKDQYPLNARLKTVRVAVMEAGTGKFSDAEEFTLNESTGRTAWQKLRLGSHGKAERIRITAVSIVKGSDFPKDICVSEIMAVKNAPADRAMPAAGQKAATVYESRPDITGCSLTQKLATRSGPGTQYAEPGTFFGKNWQQQTVKVMKKSYDGSVWWVQVDFQNGSKSKYRVWTGAKRVDVDLNKVKEEKPQAECMIESTSDTWFGPGGKYAKAKISIRKGACAVIYQRENGYADVKYWYEEGEDFNEYRVWVPEKYLYAVDTNLDHSGLT